MARARGSLVDDGDHYRLAAPRRRPGHACRRCWRPGSTRSSPARSSASSTWPSSASAATAEQVAGLGSSGRRRRPAARWSTSGLLRHGPDGRFDTVGLAARRGGLRDPAAQRPRRAAPAGRRPGGRAHEERARHLDRAADYLPDDDDAGHGGGRGARPRRARRSLAASRHLDALRLLERAVALGCRSPPALFELARIAGALRPTRTRRCDAGPDRQTTPTIRPWPSSVTTRPPTSKTFTDPAWAAPASGGGGRALAGARRPPRRRRGPAANAGVAYFNLSRMEEAAARARARRSSSSSRSGDRVGRRRRVVVPLPGQTDRSAGAGMAGRRPRVRRRGRRPLQAD